MKITQDQMNAAIESIRGGAEADGVLKSLGISRRAMQRRLYKMHIDPKALLRRGIVQAPESAERRIEQAVELYRSGETVVKSARAYGLAKNAVSDRLNKLGLLRQHGGRRKGSAPIKPKLDSNAVMSFTEIGHKLGITREAARQAFNSGMDKIRKELAKWLDEGGSAA